MPSPLHVVVLAAGRGTRMKSARPKVLHDLGGLPIIEHVLRAVDGLGAASTTLVVGHGADAVQAALACRPALEFVLQTSQLGTGDALRRTGSAMRSRHGTLLLLHADEPLLRSTTLARLVDAHHTAHAAATVLTASGDAPALGETAGAAHAFALEALFGDPGVLDGNAQAESSLMELVTILRQRGKVVETLRLDDATELRGIDTRVDLAAVDRIVRQRKNHALMMGGVTLADPATTYVDMDVAVGADTTLGPMVQLQGRTVVGERCRIHAGVRLTDATLGHDVTVLDRSVIVRSTVGDGAAVGPFAHVRPDSAIAADARVGNFVELKKTSLGAGSKANHLAYLGDATIGKRVNIGAGTITCNYDGVTKQPTIIEDDVFIGSDSQLIAPVRVGAGAYVAAGSSITADVPADALAIARARQDTKPGWAKRRRERTPATPAKKD